MSDHPTLDDLIWARMDEQVTAEAVAASIERVMARLNTVPDGPGTMVLRWDTRTELERAIDYRVQRIVDKCIDAMVSGSTTLEAKPC